MKAVGIVLRRGARRCARMMEGMKPTKVHYKHMWKCDNETLLYNRYKLIKM
jgi:hypothetical protein